MNAAQTATTVVQLDWVAITALVCSILGGLILSIFTISRMITKAFHEVDKRIHGVEIIVSPYGARMDGLDNSIQIHSDRISRLEATQDARTQIIDRHERMLESLTDRVKR